jgi:U3 small nucleolar ribonucleoprotein component
MKMYYRAKISVLFEEEMEHKHPNDVKSQKKLCVKEQGDFFQALYNSKSTEIKDIINKEHSRLYDEALKQWEQECNANHTPEAIQRCIIYSPNSRGTTQNCVQH